jgi:hypothetical protein
MSKTTQHVNYAIQRRSAHDDWDTIRETITPLEARARRLIRWKLSLRIRREFRLIKLETRTSVTPIDAEPSTGLDDAPAATLWSNRSLGWLDSRLREIVRGIFNV